MAKQPGRHKCCQSNHRNRERLADKKERFLSNRAGLFKAARLFVSSSYLPHLVIINQQTSSSTHSASFSFTEGLLKALTGFGLGSVEKCKTMIDKVASLNKVTACKSHIFLFLISPVNSKHCFQAFDEQRMVYSRRNCNSLFHPSDSLLGVSLTSPCETPWCAHHNMHPVSHGFLVL